METTRHFVATVYVVNDGAVALHNHDKLGMWLPPGGHVDRDELPHEAAGREVREELGRDVELLAPREGISSLTVESIPQPQHFLLEDINTCDGAVGHQHIDFVFYGRVDDRRIDPEPGEAGREAWEWFDAAQLRAEPDRLEPDVIEIGLQAIEAVSATR
ncbi:NUDIX family hydrolase [Halapricum desulfuricans]|uniref:NUDIX family hydrolase n=1 Tax=Halapricum desulfuricans TaxID=2841257 RepID=A0A897NQM4_9EURY|nr:NUDIX domain-containing protein [Halapricum desulfuricans]QSG13119.1 NUDIX family hydrolase [Halapricum desulfuricans]